MTGNGRTSATRGRLHWRQASWSPRTTGAGPCFFAAIGLELLALFQRAVALNPNSERAANNLELAKAALAADLPIRLPGESEASWAARLNDAGVAAMIFGDNSRAAAAFTQALNIRGTWYPRAANNLESISSR